MNNNVLYHLYINPLEKCNLRCKICYTKKTSPILSEKQIVEFIEKYQKVIDLKIITFCGGEVFTLPYFPNLVNLLTKKGIFVQIITNGTIDRISELSNPNNINLIVSIDGLENYHDLNRGKGNFKKSIGFLQKAKKSNFHIEIFSIVTKQNFSQIDLFEKYVNKIFNLIDITYHPRKPISYLNNHPTSNIKCQIEKFEFLDNKDVINLMKSKKIFPPQNLGCYQISLMSNGNIYGCCEGFESIGTITDSVTNLIKSLKQKISGPCNGCVQPTFMCGINTIVQTVNYG